MKFKGHGIVVGSFWRGFCTEAIQTELGQIETEIGDVFSPPQDRVLRFLGMNQVRCVILGQDPYPQPGVATGRAFEVRGLESWSDKRMNASLRNILKLLHRSYHNLDQPMAIQDVRGDKTFQLPPPERLLDYWESQGVLLLNTALTCQLGLAGSHKAYWVNFTGSVINYICERSPGSAWLLWGSDAGQYRSVLSDDCRVYTSSHPSSRDGSFLQSSCFQETADLVDWYGVRLTR